MLIRFKWNTTIEVCVGFDEDEEPIMIEEDIEAGEEFEVGITGVEDGVAEIEFYFNASVGFIKEDLYEIL